MTRHLLGHLAAAGIVERAGRRRFLRVSPRFLAHVEGTAGRQFVFTGRTDRHAALRDALSTWDEYRGDAGKGARFLEGLLTDRGQWGALARLYPGLEAFGTAMA